MRNHDLGRLITLGMLLLILFFGVLLSLLPSSATREGVSVTSVDDEGRRATFLVLEELGFRPRTWTRAPGHLPEGDRLLFLPAVPEGVPGYYDVEEPPEESDEERESWEEDPPPRFTPPSGVPSSRRLRDPQHYLRFLEAGGTIVAGYQYEMEEFLAEDLGLSDVHELEVSYETDDDEGPRMNQTLLLPTDEEIALRDWARGHFVPPPLTSPFETLVTDDQGNPMALALPVGRGRVVLVPQDTFLNNDTIAEADNALYLVRLVEELSPSGEVWFDEYVLGGWEPQNAVELAFTRANLGFSLHVIALVLLAVWASAWVREFPRDPEPLGRLAALERARGHADLLARSERWDLLAHMLRRGVLVRLAGRSGHGRELELESGDGGAPDRAAMAAVCVPLEARLPNATERERMRHLFLDAKPESREELERLGAELAQLEQRLATPGQKTPQGTKKHG